MAAEIPTYEPTAIIAGDTVKWTVSYAPDFSYADGARLKYRLVGASVLDIATTADTDGIGFAATIAAGSTGSLVAGQYQLVGWIEQSSENTTVYGPAPITVSPNFQTASPGALQSSAEKELALVDAQIQELLSSPTESYSIGGTSVAKRKLEDLNRQRGILIAKLGRQRGQPYPTHAVRFSAPR